MGNKTSEFEVFYLVPPPRMSGKPPIKWEKVVLPEVKKIINKYIPRITKQLTVRQIYYLLVSNKVLYHEKHDYTTFDSKMTEWREGRTPIKKRGKIIGYRERPVELDWQMIEDRARHVYNYDVGFVDIQHYINCKIKSLEEMDYNKRMWLNQPKHVEVWVEKDAMFSVFSPICKKYKVPLYTCRGYSSITHLLEALNRFPDNKTSVILHFGDFDPSGIYATESLREKLNYYNRKFFNNTRKVEVKRVALTAKQIIRLQLTPNEDLDKAKKDPRFQITRYATKYPFAAVDPSRRKYKIWELDAIEPATLQKILRAAIKKEIDKNIWMQTKRVEETERLRLRLIWKSSAREFKSLWQYLHSQV